MSHQTRDIVYKHVTNTLCRLIQQESIAQREKNTRVVNLARRRRDEQRLCVMAVKVRRGRLAGGAVPRAQKREHIRPLR